MSADIDPMTSQTISAAASSLGIISCQSAKAIKLIRHSSSYADSKPIIRELKRRIEIHRFNLAKLGAFVLIFVYSCPHYYLSAPGFCLMNGGVDEDFILVSR
jgi:hypothetical protein